MNEKLNKIFAAICIVTVVLGTIVAFALIWGSDDGRGNRDVLRRVELSLGVLFIASAVTLSVSKTLDGKESRIVHKEKDDDAA